MSGTDMLTRLEVKDGTLIVRSYQDVEDIIDNNKRQHLLGRQTGDFRKIADIPNNIAYMWLLDEWRRGNTGFKLCGPEWNAYVKKKIADPDFMHLRIAK